VIMGLVWDLCCNVSVRYFRLCCALSLINLGQCQGLCKKKKRKVHAENRQFQDNWTEDYYFILKKGSPVCLLCNESVSVNKEYNLKRHFISRHADHQKMDGQL
jgi:hypothetical protein